VVAYPLVAAGCWWVELPAAAGGRSVGLRAGAAGQSVGLPAAGHSVEVAVGSRTDRPHKRRQPG
jgi:hypothetical protein